MLIASGNSFRDDRSLTGKLLCSLALGFSIPSQYLAEKGRSASTKDSTLPVQRIVTLLAQNVKIL